VPRRWPALLAALALGNLIAGVWLSAMPTRLGDLEQVAAWSGAWVSGANPYAAPDARVDYPPWALLILSPLHFVPSPWRAAVWIPVNAVLLVVLLRRLVGQSPDPTRCRVALLMLLAATACARTLNQFSLLSYTLATVGALSTMPLLGGLGVGLSLMKPQIGGVVLVWMLLRRDWRRAALGLAVPAVLLVLFAWRVHVDPVTVGRQYASALKSVHGGSAPYVGHTELRTWLLRLVPGLAGGLTISAAVAALSLLPALVAVFRGRTRTADENLALLALCGAASLLAVRHLSYDFLLLWPALVAWRVPPFSNGESARGRALAFALLAAALVVEVPGWSRLMVSWSGPRQLLALGELDRLVTIAAWGWLSWGAVRPARTPLGAHQKMD
jgi:Glycosyltransferase family 87